MSTEKNIYLQTTAGVPMGWTENLGWAETWAGQIRARDALKLPEIKPTVRKRYKHRCKGCGKNFTDIVKDADMCSGCYMRAERENWE